MPAERLYGTDKAWIHHVYEEYKANPANPPMTLDEFKALLVTNEIRGKINLGRADLVQAMSPADIAASDTHYYIGKTKAATFNFVRVQPKSPAPAPPAQPSMAVDPRLKNKQIDKLLKAHPGAAPVNVAITPALRKRVVEQYQRWLKSGREQDLAEVRSILSADKIAPPILRYGAKGRVVIVDGHHRLIAYVLRGLTSIDAYVTGTPQ